MGACRYFTKNIYTATRTWKTWEIEQKNLVLKKVTPIRIGKYDAYISNTDTALSYLKKISRFLTSQFQREIVHYIDETRF